MSEPPLRLCLLSHSYPPRVYDGIGRLTQLMARGLIELGHSVHVITRGDFETATLRDGIHIHTLVPPSERYIQYRHLPNLCHGLNYSHHVYDKVKQLTRSHGIQIVDSPLWLFEGLITQISKSIPTVVRLVTAGAQVNTLHQTHNADTRLVAQIERELIERASHVLPNTQSTLELARRVYGVELPRSRYTVVPYGIVPVNDDATSPISLESDSRSILFVGRLEKRKGILDLFNALPIIMKTHPNTTVVIAGADNSEHDGFASSHGMTYPQYFQKHFSAYQGSVHFTGEIDDVELQSLYRSCDLFVAPSLHESFGLIYLEAMNFAKPVIGCAVGGVPEVVENGATGKLIEPETPQSLANAVISLLNNPAQMREMGLAGRARLLRDFTYLGMAQRFADVYRKVISYEPTNT